MKTEFYICPLQPPLNQWVQFVWISKGEDDATKSRILPNGVIELIINFGNRQMTLDRDTLKTHKYFENYWVAGIQTQPLFIQSLTNTNLVGIRFLPGGAYPFFKKPVEQFSNDVVEAAWMAEELGQLRTAINNLSDHDKKEKPAQPLATVKKQTSVLTDSIINTSFVAGSGEKFLRLELIVNKPLNEVWKIMSTENGLKKWIAPVVLLDLKAGGTLKTNYNKAAAIGDDGTITLDIISYLPAEMLILKVNLNESFPEKCRNEDKNLQEIIQVKPLGKNKTKITSTMVGWGQGKEWDEAYTFFEKGNKWTFGELLQCLQK